MGDALQDAWSLSGRIQFFLERSSYGTYIFGRADLLLARRRDLLESRLPIRPLPSAPERFAVEGERVLRDLTTGACAYLPSAFAAQTTPLGILAWWPEKKPVGGVLLSAESLSPLTTWSRS
jgi:hypothetical protein